jgi:two-component system, NarL family, nitrate/nitrite response regulator NarL
VCLPEDEQPTSFERFNPALLFMRECNVHLIWQPWYISFVISPHPLVELRVSSNGGRLRCGHAGSPEALTANIRTLISPSGTTRTSRPAGRMRLPATHNRCAARPERGRGRQIISRCRCSRVRDAVVGRFLSTNGLAEGNIIVRTLTASAFRVGRVAPVRRVNIVIADPCPIFVRGLVDVLAAERDFNVLATACDGEECMNALRDLSPDIAVVDCSLPGSPALDILAAVTSEHLSTRLVFLVGSQQTYESAIAAAGGGYGVIPKEASPQIFVSCLRRIAQGRNSLPLSFWWEDSQRAHNGTEHIGIAALTERERQIMYLVAEGLSNKAIGRRLNLSDGTVKVHLHNIYQKLAITNRTSLAAMKFAASALEHINTFL